MSGETSVNYLTLEALREGGTLLLTIYQIVVVFGWFFIITTPNCCPCENEPLVALFFHGIGWTSAVILSTWVLEAFISQFTSEINTDVKEEDLASPIMPSSSTTPAGATRTPLAAIPTKRTRRVSIVGTSQKPVILGEHSAEDETDGVHHSVLRRRLETIISREEGVPPARPSPPRTPRLAEQESSHQSNDDPVPMTKVQWIRQIFGLCILGIHFFWFLIGNISVLPLFFKVGIFDNGDRFLYKYCKPIVFWQSFFMLFFQWFLILYFVIWFVLDAMDTIKKMSSSLTALKRKHQLPKSM